MVAEHDEVDGSEVMYPCVRSASLPNAAAKTVAFEMMFGQVEGNPAAAKACDCTRSGRKPLIPRVEYTECPQSSHTHEDSSFSVVSGAGRSLSVSADWPAASPARVGAGDAIARTMLPNPSGRMQLRCSFGLTGTASGRDRSRDAVPGCDNVGRED